MRGQTGGSGLKQAHKGTLPTTCTGRMEPCLWYQTGRVPAEPDHSAQGAADFRSHYSVLTSHYSVCLLLLYRAQHLLACLEETCNAARVNTWLCLLCSPTEERGGKTRTLSPAKFISHV